MIEELPVGSPLAHEDGVVREEIWRSLVSMLRAYAYAASLTRGEIAVTEPSGREARLEYRGEVFVLRFESGSGRGTVEFAGRSAGSFTMQNEGELSVGGKEKQLDEAAIEWVEELTRTAGKELS